MVMRHRAGLNAPSEDLTFQNVLDLEPVEAAFARQAPIWEPDSGFAYHALSIGHLLGKILYNVTGKRLNQLVQEELTNPLDATFYIGIPENHGLDIAHLISDGPHETPQVVVGSNEYWQGRAMSYGTAMISGVDSFDGGFNDPRLHRAELGGAGGITDARSLARIYSSAVIMTDGVRLMKDQTILDAIARPNPGDNIYREPQPHPVHSLGFIVSNAQHNPVLSPHTFGHDGLGGQQAFGDLDSHLGFGYITNWIPLVEDGFTRQREITAELVRSFT